MLTLHHPELMHTVLNYPIGLYALTIKGNNRSALVVKANKEALLASQLNKGFQMYVVPMDVGGKVTVGIMSAFFDDCDEPLVIYTTLFDDAASTLLKQVVLGGELHVHLFDECNRELLGYSALVRVPPITRVHLEQAHFLPFEQATARAMLDKLPVWFGLRNVLDDAAAIAVDFGETLFPDDLFIQDLRPEHHTRLLGAKYVHRAFG